MKLYELSFAKIIKLRDDIAEVIVNEGIEYDMDMVEEYHQWIREHLQAPCYMLVNRLNSYTYTFEVQRKLATIPEIKAIALVVYNRSSLVGAEAIANIPKVRPWNSQICTSREDALAWLESQRN